MMAVHARPWTSSPAAPGVNAGRPLTELVSASVGYPQLEESIGQQHLYGRHLRSTLKSRWARSIARASLQPSTDLAHASIAPG